ncbi:MAG: tRNA lysidine(34) synthetase TilS [Saprospiraceae bacterium]|nr:tRNA lysidine(34) synthetase TilS [Saprospiraceae bacterium]
MKHILDKFQSFITDNELFAEDEKILLAVSGGVDSVVLCHLFFQAKLNFGIAHCNFQLRGEASHEDELFVKNLAQQLKVPFFSTVFDTKEFAETQKISIQMAARDLRYEWLEQIRQQNDFQWIATAHHLNDSIETLFYNFAKGTGIRGLQGIPMKNNRIIRPLLFATKDEILAFAKAENIIFREDASNEEDKYARNKIRHHVIPILQEINPNFEQTAAKNLKYLREAEYLYQFSLDQIRQQVVIETDHELKINTTKLIDYQFIISTLLYEWLKPFGFNSDQIAQILEAATGAIFYSPTHRLTVDRTLFILQKQALDTSPEQFVIPSGSKKFESNVGTLTLEYKTGQPNAFTDDPFVVYLDAEKLTYPLMLRHWQAGDFFYPLGLGGSRQKLQDFFTHQKLSRFEKERVWILASGDDICWIIGLRMDERFKITPETKYYYIIRFKTS